MIKNAFVSILSLLLLLIAATFSAMILNTPPESPNDIVPQVGVVGP